MNRGWDRRAVWLAGVVALSSLFVGCIAESAFRVRGRVILRGKGEPSKCVLRFYSDANKKLLQDRDIEASFETSFVIAPRKRDYFMEIQCAGTKPYVTKTYELGDPKWYTNPLDLGDIVLDDATGKGVDEAAAQTCEPTPADPPGAGPFRFVPTKITDKRFKNRHPQLTYVVNEDGTVSNVRIVKGTGSPKMDAALVRSIEAWKYKPLPGCVVETTVSVIIDLY